MGRKVNRSKGHLSEILKGVKVRADTDRPWGIQGVSLAYPFLGRHLKPSVPGQPYTLQGPSEWMHGPDGLSHRSCSPWKTLLSIYKERDQLGGLVR